MTKTKQPTHHAAAGAKYWIYNPKATKTIVAIHGLRGTHHGLQFIAKSLPGCRFIIPDLPGFGDSKPLTKKTHTVKNYALWLDTFMNELAFDHPPILLGHSFGSIIAGHYVSEHADKISKLILINPIATHGNLLSSLIGKGFYQLGRLLPERTGTKFLKSRLATRIMTEAMLTTRQKRLRDRVYQQHFAYFGTFANRQSVHEAFNTSMSGSVLDYVTRLTIPVLLIVGVKDRLAPLKGQRQLRAKLPDSKLKIIPNVGHLIHYETPEKAASYINAFLSEPDK